MAHVKSQSDRDEQSLVIATVLAVFVGTLLIGATLGAIGDRLGLWGGDAALDVAIAAAAVAGALYGNRHQLRPTHRGRGGASPSSGQDAHDGARRSCRN
jgi:uncharacterized protein YcfJ